MPVQAWIVLRQSHHTIPEKKSDGITYHVAPSVYAIFPLRLEPEFSYVIGRFPVLSDLEQAIIIPNQAVTAKLARINCLTTAQDGSLHLLLMESSKRGQEIIEKASGLPCRKHVLRNGDEFIINNLPLRLYYYRKHTDASSDIELFSTLS